ncbi:site-specific integrase [bacterium]|nr:site-specific integrase [bacterium]
MLYKSRKYKKVSPVWLDTLKISKSRLNRAGLADSTYYSQEETIRMCSFEPKNLIDKRDRAAVAMLFLSSMRVSALTSIRVDNIDLAAMTIYQNPADGVRTKNGKSMETILLPIEFLLGICEEWYTELKQEIGENALWYPTLSTDGLRFSKSEMVGDVDSRNKSLRDGVNRLCKYAGIRYLSPHKFRRGHGVYAVEHSPSLKEFEAYSQNMGHENVATTFIYYSKLANNVVKDTILNRK